MTAAVSAFNVDDSTLPKAAAILLRSMTLTAAFAEAAVGTADADQLTVEADVGVGGDAGGAFTFNAF